MYKLTNKWFVEHKGLLHDCVNRYSWKFNYNQERQDLYSVACEAVCKAATRYSPNKNVSFETFAYNYMKWYITQYTRQSSSLLSITKYLTRDYNKLKEINEKYKTFTVGELYKYNYMKIDNTNPAQDVQDKLDLIIASKEIKKLVSSKQKTVQDKLDYLFDFDTLQRKHTVGEAAKHFNITHQVISKTERKFLNEVKLLLKDY